MVNILPKGQDPIGQGIAGLLPALFQQLGQQNQQQQLMSLLGGGAVGGLAGLLGGQGGNNDQLSQLMKIAQEAGVEDEDQFKTLLMDSGLFGQGNQSPQAPQSLLQSILGGGMRNIKSLGNAAGGGLADFLVNNLPGSII